MDQTMLENGTCTCIVLLHKLNVSSFINKYLYFEMNSERLFKFLGLHKALIDIVYCLSSLRTVNIYMYGRLMVHPPKLTNNLWDCETICTPTYTFGDSFLLKK